MTSPVMPLFLGRQVIIMKTLCILLIMLGVFVSINSAARELHPLDCQPSNERQDLNNYQAQNVDEKHIIKLVLTYQKACNLYDPASVFATYAPDALIKAGINDAGSARMVKKEKYFALLVEKLSKWKLYHFTLHLLTPEKIHVKGNKAILHVSYLLFSLTQEYWEKGSFTFDLRKAGDKWLISKNSWAIKDLHYNP
jgi:hypothetical protein